MQVYVAAGDVGRCPAPRHGRNVVDFIVGAVVVVVVVVVVVDVVGVDGLATDDLVLVVVGVDRISALCCSSICLLSLNVCPPVGSIVLCRRMPTCGFVATRRLVSMSRRAWSMGTWALFAPGFCNSTASAQVSCVSVADALSFVVLFVCAPRSRLLLPFVKLHALFGSASRVLLSGVIADSLTLYRDEFDVAATCQRTAASRPAYASAPWPS